MRNKGFLLSILIIVVVGATIYAYLGGFSQPKIKEAVSQEMYIAGKMYQGSVKDPELGELFQQAGDLHDNNVLPGDLGNIFYNDPEKHNDSINAFIGLIVPDTQVALPAGYEIRKMPAGKKVLQVSIEAHYMLAPGKMYPALQKYASEKKLKLQDVFVERYHNSHEAIVVAYLEESPQQ